MILIDCEITGKAIPMPRPRAFRGLIVSNTPEIKQWKEWVQFVGATNRRVKTPTTENVGCELTFFREKWTKRCDADNLAKPILDSLNGILWVDDSQVWTLTVHKATSIGRDPRVLIKAWELEAI